MTVKILVNNNLFLIFLESNRAYIIMDDSLDGYPKPFSLNFVDDDDDVNSLFEKINPATQEPLSQADFEFEDNFNEDESRTGIIFY